MRRFLTLWTLPFVLVVSSCSPTAEIAEEAPVATGPGGPASADASALSHADQIVAAVGGWDGWARSRYIAFDFVVQRDRQELRRRTLRWDRFENRSRVMGTDREGRAYDLVIDTETGEGTALLDGVELEGDEQTEWLERARALWINDTYWLVLPFKLHDPGVHLVDEGEREIIEDVPSHVIRVSFEPETGLTPGDQYWVHFDPETHYVLGWEYHLESMEEDAEPTLMLWDGWKQLGPIQLPLFKSSPDQAVAIVFDNVEVSETVPADAF